MDHINDLTRLLRSGKKQFYNRTFSGIIHGRKASVLQGTAVERIHVIQTDISIHKDAGLGKHNEYAWLTIDNRQVILGHEDVDRDSYLYI